MGIKRFISSIQLCRGFQMLLGEVSSKNKQAIQLVNNKTLSTLVEHKASKVSSFLGR
jgi:hypothetical protein